MWPLVVTMLACRSGADCEPAAIPCFGDRTVESCRDERGSFYRLDGATSIYCDSFTDCAAAEAAIEGLCASPEHSETGDSDVLPVDTGGSEVESDTGEDSNPGPVDDRDGDGVTLQQGDCYDDNALVYPGQMAFFSEHRGDGTWDYNCDLVQEKRFQVTSVCNPSGTARCTRSTVYTGQSSHGVHWAEGVPACGQSGPSIIGCEFVDDHCEPVVEPVVQACR